MGKWNGNGKAYTGRWSWEVTISRYTNGIREGVLRVLILRQQFTLCAGQSSLFVSTTRRIGLTQGSNEATPLVTLTTTAPSFESYRSFLLAQLGTVLITLTSRYIEAFLCVHTGSLNSCIFRFPVDELPIVGDSTVPADKKRIKPKRTQKRMCTSREFRTTETALKQKSLEH